MPSDRPPLKTAAVAYLGVAGVVVAWAWYIDLSLLGSPREHLLPDLVLMICGLPSSLLLGPIYGQWPGSFNGLAQTAFLTFCALAQSGLVVALAFRRFRRAKA